MSARWILLISMLSLALGSCSGSTKTAVEQSPDLAPSGAQEIYTQEPSSDITATPSSQDKLVNLTKQDLAYRLKIDPAQVTLIKTMEIKSPNISAGCKLGEGQILMQGGQIYGYRVWLEAAGEEYIYHVGLTEQIIFCPELTPGVNNPLLMTPDGTTQVPQDQSP